MTTFKLSSLEPALQKLRPEYARADRNGNRNGVLNQAEVRAQGQRANDRGATERALVTVYNWAKADHWDELVAPGTASAYLDKAAALISSHDRNRDGVLTGAELTAARKNKTGAALIDYVEATTATKGRAEVVQELAALAPELTLGMFGEDSGGFVTVSSRKRVDGPLTEDAALTALGFRNLDDIKSSDAYAFHPVSKDDAQFWDIFVESQTSPAGEDAARKVRELFADAVEIVSVVADPTPRSPFSAMAYLVAKLQDGSAVALRGEIGGMTL
ncbi:MAG: hypothetical protein AB1938_08210 [Myxococcota bacterium]